METNFTYAKGTLPMTFDAGELEALRRALPPPPQWLALVVSPVAYARIKQLAEANTVDVMGLSSLAGIPVHEKSGQLCDAWAFADRELLQVYLQSKLTEEGLEQLSTGRREVVARCEV